MSDDAYANKIPWQGVPEMVETPIYGPVTSTLFTTRRHDWVSLMGPQKAWVLWHRYSDGSAAHVERVYLDERRAKQDYELLTHGMDGKPEPSASEWQLTELTITG